MTTGTYLHAHSGFEVPPQDAGTVESAWSTCVLPTLCALLPGPARVAV